MVLFALAVVAVGLHAGSRAEREGRRAQRQRLQAR